MNWKEFFDDDFCCLLTWKNRIEKHIFFKIYTYIIYVLYYIFIYVFKITISKSKLHHPNVEETQNLFYHHLFFSHHVMNSRRKKLFSKILSYFRSSFSTFQGDRYCGLEPNWFWIFFFFLNNKKINKKLYGHCFPAPNISNYKFGLF